MTRMAIVQTDDGVNLAYETHGTGSTTLLFLHGWAGSGAFFNETIAQLDLAGLRVVAYDMRGHGASDKVESGYTLDRFTQDALAVADAAGAAEIVPIGYSLSAKIAQYLAVVHPERIPGLLLVSGMPAAKLPFPEEMYQAWVAMAGDRAALHVFEQQFLTQPVAPDIVDRWADDAVKVPRVALDETLAMAVRISFADRVGQIQVPTLVVGGQHDPVVTPELLRGEVVAPLTGTRARLVVVDSNHDVPIELPRQMAGLIEAFIAGLG
jgi:non-heme chloroperoxidase